ncbi:hypothetical protein TH63_05600 [Rufibacter radiotolerans]|uniref:Uncharacterized protein n=1 Tax=Rufibacter radiotolerans TaxID=1379910 RepID=A0A0H4VMX8_9BACT|nr:hypothetical protein TH63_05600 [Rufibacter radiotolerans]
MYYKKSRWISPPALSVLELFCRKHPQKVRSIIYGYCLSLEGKEKRIGIGADARKSSGRYEVLGACGIIEAKESASYPLFRICNPEAPKRGFAIPFFCPRFHSFGKGYYLDCQGTGQGK